MKSFSFFCLLLLLVPCAESSAADKQPDIVFLFADDLAYDCVGYNGNSVVKTPNIDRLARRSTSFTRAYNMGSWTGAVCVASRAMVNTGQFVWQAKNAVPNQMSQQKQLWSQQFEKVGYRTCMAGKWHVKADAAACFGQTATVRPGMPQSVQLAYDRPQSREDQRWKPWDKKQGGYWEGGKHWSEVTADEGIAFINQSKDDEKPYFLYLAFNAPHDPRQAPKEFVDMYPPEKVDLPAGYQPMYPYKDAIGCGSNLRDEQLAPFPRTEYAVKVHRGEYYALITHLDQQIGRVLDALEKSGRLDNTLVVFTSDHGLACGHHGLLGKQNMYEHSVRVPFLLSGPGITASRQIDTPIYLQDIVPTTLETAGVPIPERVQFKSLHPLLQGKSSQQHPAIYGAYMKLQRMILIDDWKLIHYPKANIYRLYHLENDPQELLDLASDPAEADRLKQMKQQLKAMQQVLQDPLAVSR